MDGIGFAQFYTGKNTIMFGLERQQKSHLLLSVAQQAMIVCMVGLLALGLAIEQWRVMALLAGIALPFVVMCGTLLFQRKTQKMVVRIRDMLENIDHGLVYFDPESGNTASNLKAKILLPDLPQIQSFKTFLTYIFDHSLDHHGAMDAYLEQAQIKTPIEQKNSFQELIRVGAGRVMLVKVHQSRDRTIVAIITDVTPVYRQYESMIELNRRHTDLITAIDYASDGIFIIDSMSNDYPVLFMNHEARVIFGRAPSSGGIEKISDILLACAPETDIKNLMKKLEKGDEMVVPILVHHQQRRGERSYEIRLAPVMGAGVSRLIIGFMIDKTDEKARDAVLLQSQKLEAIGQLAGGVAHDFNNLLSIIEGYTRLGSKIADLAPEAKTYFSRIGQAVQRGSALTRHLLLFGSHHISDDHVFDLSVHLSNDENLLRPLLPADIQLNIIGHDSILPVECSPDALSQIVMNLALNARDAMPDGGKIMISVTRVDDQWACLTVSDNGSGIAPDIQDKIFDPFFTTKGPGKGTGLGLSMVYGLVKQMRGQIRLESTPGMGTTFRILIPLTERTPVLREAIGSSANADSIRLPGYTALVAEDEPELREIMCSALKKSGMTVLEAANGADALSIQDSWEDTIDFLITDVSMPELNGIKLDQLMREIRPNVQTIFMSGYPAKGQMATFTLPDDAIFLAKPISPDDVISILFDQIRNAGDGSRKSFAEWNKKHH